jgi:hypothetical protein
VRTLRPSDALRELAPVGRLYLPTASYVEMLHWALPSARSYRQYEEFEHQLKDDGTYDRYSQFVRGGFWRNFLVKYPEANAMQKKMLRISNRIDALRRGGGPVEAAAARLDEAYEHLLAAQCNCPYWHGVFGGLYLANIRAAMYREMITAERMLDAIEGRNRASVEVVDYDFDGFVEIIAENPSIALYVAPERGGGILELDHKPSRYNFCDLLQRRREGYHQQLVDAAEKQQRGAGEEAQEESGTRSIHDTFKVKEEGLERRLAYDLYRHGLFIDHFFGHDITPATLRDGTATERGDFATGRYEFHWGRFEDGRTRIQLRRRGTVDGAPVVVEKTLAIDDRSSSIDVEYRVASLDGAPLAGLFGVEMSYSMSAGNEPDRYYEIDGRRIAHPEGRLASEGEAVASRFALVDEWLAARIGIELERPARLLRTPVETVSLSEDGFERNYQGSLLVALWDLGGVPEWRIAIRQRIDQVQARPGVGTA